MDNTNEIIQALADLLALDTFKTFAAGDLVKRFASVEDEHRYDPVIRNVGGAIEKMAQRDPGHVVSAEEIQRLYQNFVGLNPQSQFKKVFADLLPTEDLAAASRNPFDRKRVPYHDESRDLTTAQKEAIDVDEWEAALEQSVEALVPGVAKFDPNLLANNVMHNPELVNAGRDLVRTQLEVLGCMDVRAGLKHGVKNCLLYLASFSTPIGTVHMNIPIEIKNGEPQVPEVLADITGKNIYAFNTAGIAKAVADIMERRAQAQQLNIDSRRANFTSDVRDTSQDAIEVDEVEAYAQEVVPGKRLSEINPELANVEAILEDAVIRKASRYTEQAIKLGRDIVTEEFKKQGYKCDARFVGDHNRGMTFDATLWTKKGKVEVSVPVEVAEGDVLFPAVFVADDGEVHKLDRAEVEAMLDVEGLAEIPRYSAALVNMTYNDLRKIVHKATFDRKHNIAREALTLIKDKFGNEAHTAAVSDYQEWIEEATRDYEQRCGSCDYYKPRGVTVSSSDHALPKKSSTDYCNLLHTQCSNVTRRAGVCTRSHLDWDRQHDDAYKGIITTNQIKLT